MEKQVVSNYLRDILFENNEHGLLNESECYQIDKLAKIIESGTHSIIINNSDYPVVIFGEEYFDRAGCEFILDLYNLEKNFNYYIDHWCVPTLEGAEVDFSLIK